MESTQSQPQSGSNLLSIAQMIVSGLGIIFALVAAGGIGLFGLVGLFSESMTPDEVTSLLFTGWISLIVVALTVPSLLLSIQRVFGLNIPFPKVNTFRLANIAILVWPLVLLLGSLVAHAQFMAWLLLPPLGLLAIGLPIWWIIEFARRKLSAGSQQRSWGLASFGMLITTPTLMFVEILAMGIILVFFAIWVSTQPDILRMLQRLGERLTIGQPDPQAVIETLSPYLQNPVVIFVILAIVAGIVPLIEELFKPLAMWMLVGRKLTPAQGFVAGAICGGSFALIESLFYLSNPMGESWAALAAGRAGTGLLHTTTTALFGWALASAWQKGSYLRLGGAYLLACVLHGLWNGLSILAGLSGAIGNATNLSLLANLGQFAWIGLGFLILILLLILWWSNRRLVQPEHEVLADIQP